MFYRLYTGKKSPNCSQVFIQFLNLLETNSCFGIVNKLMKAQRFYLYIFCSTALIGVDLKALLDGAANEVGGKLLVDFYDTIGDRIQVFLE